MAVRHLVTGIAVVLIMALAVIGCVLYQDIQTRDWDSRARAALEAVLRTSGYSVSVLGLESPLGDGQGIGAYVYLGMDGARDEAAAVCALVAATRLFDDERPEQVRVAYGPTPDESVKCD